MTKLKIIEFICETKLREIRLFLGGGGQIHKCTCIAYTSAIYLSSQTVKFSLAADMIQKT